MEEYLAYEFVRAHSTPYLATIVERTPFIWLEVQEMFDESLKFAGGSVNEVMTLAAARELTHPCVTLSTEMSFQVNEDEACAFDCFGVASNLRHVTLGLLSSIRLPCVLDQRCSTSLSLIV